MASLWHFPHSQRLWIPNRPGWESAPAQGCGRTHIPYTVPSQCRDTTCGHCAAYSCVRCLACLRRPPSGVCLRRSRPLSHPMGTPREWSGTAPASRRAGAGKPSGHPSPQPPGFPKGFPRTPFLCPSRPTRRARFAGQNTCGTGRRNSQCGNAKAQTETKALSCQARRNALRSGVRWE